MKIKSSFFNINIKLDGNICTVNDPISHKFTAITFSLWIESWRRRVMLDVLSWIDHSQSNPTCIETDTLFTEFNVAKQWVSKPFLLAK